LFKNDFYVEIHFGLNIVLIFNIIFIIVLISDVFVCKNNEGEKEKLVEKEEENNQFKIGGYMAEFMELTMVNPQNTYASIKNISFKFC
jgi:hypothetical protein